MKSNYSLIMLSVLAAATALAAIFIDYKHTGGITAGDVSLLFSAGAVCVLLLRLLQTEKLVDELRRRLTGEREESDEE